MRCASVAESADLKDAILGCLLGGAVGDAIGLPAEGLSKPRLTRVFGEIDGHRLLFGRGMTSDDTDHLCLVAQSLIESGGEPAAFAKDLARRLRRWLVSVPPGAGLATLKATLKLCVGFPPQRSGVFSAGNGPAMRAPLIGVCFGADPYKLRQLVGLSTRMTHTDPRALYGALAVASAASTAANRVTPPDPDLYVDRLLGLVGDEGQEIVALAARAAQSARAGRSTESFAAELGFGAGVSGYVYATVPVVLHAWFTNPADVRSAVLNVIRCGGDTDTTAAIAGGIVGAASGSQGIPEDWLRGLIDWPRGIAWFKRLAAGLAQAVQSEAKASPPEFSLPLAATRNFALLMIVLSHGFRRLLPPY